MRRWRNLTTRLSLLVALAVMLVLLIVGVYFDLFLRRSFQDTTVERMLHAYQRFESNVSQIEQHLIDGVNFAQTNQSLVASVSLINQYEDPNHYNTFLIDEEKKTIGQELLDRVKLSFNDDIAVYGEKEQLIAFASREAQTYRVGYVTYERGRQLIRTQVEGESEFRPGRAPDNISVVHQIYPNEDKNNTAPLVTFHKLGRSLAIKVHQHVIDPYSGRYIAHLELSRILDTAYFSHLSEDLDLQLSLQMEARSIPVWSQLKAIRDDMPHLQPQADGNHYHSAIGLPVIEGQVFVQASIDSRLLAGLLNTHRTRFVLLLVVLAALVLWMTRQFILRTLTKPLGLLMAQIHRIEQGHYEVMPPLATGDELQQISVSVNELSQAVQEREDSLERARHEQEFLSNHDALTGLPNRRFFAMRLEHALDLARRQRTELGVLFLDLDNFKLVNDTQGHNVGDQLLIAVAQRMAGHVREADTLARIGGDEFNLLIENVENLAHFENLVSKLLELFREPFLCGKHDITSTVSIGIAMFPRDGTDSDTLLKHADLAVYQSKDRGRANYSFFSQELSTRVRYRADLIHALNQAIEAGNQFSLAFQPKVSAQTGKVVSAEALIRWNSPHFGLVSPAQFIPIAEETGQILDVGAWVIRQTCHDLAVMRAQQLELNHLSINVSGVQLRVPTLSTVLTQEIERHGLRPQWLEMEITESFIAQDTQQAIATLNAFRAMGMQLAIDDFGTGYSSMSYLHKLPFTRVKIDKSFIDGLPHNQDSVSITRAILALAKNFNLSTTAEGVETEQQLAFLRQEGCDEIQGYYYAKPLPLADFLAFCQNNLAGA
jgi:diguanylate cyclase (GGDEF)-like protein